MSFKEFRNCCKSSTKHEFNIERFSYDVFAYMLRICDFPEEKIPTTSLKENVYTDNNFIMNVGLSALPISLYMRDEWMITFDVVIGEGGIHNILEIQNYLESFIADSDELEEEDTIGKIQYSLALYSEYTLFLNFKGIFTFHDRLPKLWSHLCKVLVEESEDFDQTLESSLTMCPDVSESWITNFIRNFAIPYGSCDEVSNRFSMLTLKCHGENDIFPGESSGVAPERTVVMPSEVEEGDTVTLHPEGSISEMNLVPLRCGSNIPSSQLQNPGGNSFAESRARGRHTNGLSYVLQLSIKKRKRSGPEELEVEDAFGKLNLEKENISPENHNTKRMRKTSGEETLE